MRAPRESCIRRSHWTTSGSDRVGWADLLRCVTDRAELPAAGYGDRLKQIMQRQAGAVLLVAQGRSDVETWLRSCVSSRPDTKPGSRWLALGQASRRRRPGFGEDEGRTKCRQHSLSRGIVVFSEDAVNVLEFVPCPRRAAVLNL